MIYHKDDHRDRYIAVTRSPNHLVIKFCWIAFTQSERYEAVKFVSDGMNETAYQHL